MTKDEAKKAFIRINNKIMDVIVLCEDHTAPCAPGYNKEAEKLGIILITELEDLQHYIAQDILKYFDDKPQPLSAHQHSQHEPQPAKNLFSAANQEVRDEIENLSISENCIDSYETAIKLLVKPYLLEAVMLMLDGIEAETENATTARAHLDALGYNKKDVAQLLAAYNDLGKEDLEE